MTLPGFSAAVGNAARGARDLFPIIKTLAVGILHDYDFDLSSIRIYTSFKPTASNMGMRRDEMLKERRRTAPLLPQERGLARAHLRFWFHVYN